MNKPIFMAADAGNKNLNVFAEGMKEPVVIPNIQANVREYNSIQELGFFAKKQTNPVNCLDITVVSNGKNLGRKYIGNAAIRYGGEERPLNKEKYNDDDILFSILAGLAYALYDPNKPIKNERIALGTCLPIYEYLNREKIKEHEKRLAGKHTITFNDKIFNGSVITIEILADDIITMPEGTAALFNMMTDEEGAVLPEYMNETDKIDIVVDIGGGTTDISAVMNFEPVSELVDSIDTGLLYAEERILKTIRSMNRNYILNKAELDYYIRKDIMKISFGNNVVDITDIVNKEFAEIGSFIAEKVNNMIQLVPTNFKRLIHKVNLTGGSSILISKYIKDAVNGYEVVLSKTPLNDNVLGCYKSIKLMNKMREAATGEDEIYEDINN